MSDMQSQLIDSQYAESIIKGDTASYDHIEIHGVINLNEPDDPAGTHYVIEDDNPELYSVYLHCVEGGIECVGDFSTHSMAMKYAEELSAIYRWEISAFCHYEE